MAFFVLKHPNKYKGGVIMSEVQTQFNRVNKVSLQELDAQLQFQISLIGGMTEDLGNIYPGATKVENLGNGKIKINDVEAIVYSHPASHPASMITGLANVATSGKYTDLSGCPTSLPASDVYDWAKAATKPTYTAAEVKAIPLSSKGTANGVAELDTSAKIPIAQLPDNLYQIATSGVLSDEQVPILDITTHLKDNDSTSLVLGGLGAVDIA